MTDAIDIDLVYGCWLAKRTDERGYGITFRGGHPVKLHVITWREHGHGVPDGMVLDHRCRRRACCNVQHLELVTQTVNLHRRRWGNRVRATTCPNGHDLKLNAMVTPEGGRLCRICDR